MCSKSWWSRCHWCRARFHHADAIPSMVTLSLVSCSVSPRRRNTKYRFHFLLDFVVHFCTCSQTVFCDRQFLPVAIYCTLLHRENGSFEVLSLQQPNSSGSTGSSVFAELSIFRTSFSPAPLDRCKHFGLFSAIILSPRPTHSGSTNVWPSDSTLPLSNTLPKPFAPRLSSAQLAA